MTSSRPIQFSDSALQMQVLSAISEISAELWNGLHASDNPFIQHQFLAALERHGCVSERFGWVPKHLLFWQNEELYGAVILYEKHNNYGEFVFDHAWQQAWQSVGLPYYPKLVSAVPYTPARGPRIILAPSIRTDLQRSQAVTKQIVQALQNFAAEHDYSGAHILFSEEQSSLARQNEVICRHDVQFQWFNQNYVDFADFLAYLKPKKRKNIRQERRQVLEQGITFRVLSGDQASEQDWRDFDYFYQKTFIEKWSTPTLNFAFFAEVALTMPQHVVLVLAQRAGQTVAGALMFRSNSVLYGRHWGCVEEVKHLHFETCFYQGIDYAIAHGLTRFEPGAGGEHKISRGFIPVPMQSAHWLTVNPFVQGISAFVEEERQMLQGYMQEIWQASPYLNNVPLQARGREFDPFD
ncbi:hypothetical protein THMIRHAS_24170 [Thiosulfatimonas sediminis]|uniref:N-acetyltransferase n=1 Tax=Thiosulfatimonas sediminis TaxID=2675054 RepID=A0A6F8PYH0_9GAMM|nr:GNAT family N-acetyltransferase [Thiosulfatimonas sediminis]BBP47044.1 hypothetical protein THMIRHAS_24170 [Thiosulfatimonas sediminis]